MKWLINSENDETHGNTAQLQLQLEKMSSRKRVHGQHISWDAFEFRKKGSVGVEILNHWIHITVFLHLFSWRLASRFLAFVEVHQKAGRVVRGLRASLRFRILSPSFPKFRHTADRCPSSSRILRGSHSNFSRFSVRRLPTPRVVGATNRLTLFFFCQSRHSSNKNNGNTLACQICRIN